MVGPLVDYRRHGQARKAAFDGGYLIVGLLLDGLALEVWKVGESFLKMLSIKDRNGKCANAAMATTLTAGNLV